MTIVIFAGPTISKTEIISIVPTASCRSPAARGDVFAAVRDGASIIGLIDGYFHQRPSVWHKELLWALASGVTVLGSASMGALRAAELAIFGMIGVGKIFADFRSGKLEDDDEVAVAHGPPELDYLSCSEAMVDIRATLHLARRLNVIDRTCHDRLISAAKTMHFTERSIAAAIRCVDCDADDMSTLVSWLDTGVVRQKKNDAREMLRLIASRKAVLRKKADRFVFEDTLHWQQFVQSCTTDLTRVGASNAPRNTCRIADP